MKTIDSAVDHSTVDHSTLDREISVDRRVFLVRPFGMGPR
jgi:hypothetical protein